MISPLLFFMVFSLFLRFVLPKMTRLKITLPPAFALAYSGSRRQESAAFCVVGNLPDLRILAFIILHCNVYLEITHCNKKNLLRASQKSNAGLAKRKEPDEIPLYGNLLCNFNERRLLPRRSGKTVFHEHWDDMAAGLIKHRDSIG